jgi:hypothetical protein
MLDDGEALRDLVLVLVLDAVREEEAEGTSGVSEADIEEVSLAVSEAVSELVSEAVLEAERLLVLLAVREDDALAGLLLDAVLLLEGVREFEGTRLLEAEAEGKLHSLVGMTVGWQSSESSKT